MPDEVEIRGGGVAACCCAALLSQAGYRVYADAAKRAASPMLMLSEQTQRLLKDVFGGDDLLDGAVEIRERVVTWGNAEMVRLPHSGLVISESLLLERLWALLDVHDIDERRACWRVLSAKPFMPSVSEHKFGMRMASACTVTLREVSESCWVESAERGWLFLVPSRGNAGSLICVGESTAELLGESRLIAGLIEEVGAVTGTFPAYPRIVTPICGDGWIACGTSAIAFDPIAGEGMGHALREGILAAAVIKASKGLLQRDLLGHYSNRMFSGFLRHLQDCCRFYEAVEGEWWRSELALMKQGLEWTQSELGGFPGGKFRLVGFDLQGR